MNHSQQKLSLYTHDEIQNTSYQKIERQKVSHYHTLSYEEDQPIELL